MAGSVEIDTTALEAYMHRLATALDRGGDTVAHRQATTTAEQVRSNVPRRTGRLAGTVNAAPDGEGWSVHYGDGLPYAAYIEKRSRACARAVAGADQMFLTACHALAVVQTR